MNFGFRRDVGHERGNGRFFICVNDWDGLLIYTNLLMVISAPDYCFCHRIVSVSMNCANILALIAEVMHIEECQQAQGYNFPTFEEDEPVTNVGTLM